MGAELGENPVAAGPAHKMDNGPTDRNAENLRPLLHPVDACQVSSSGWRVELPSWG